MSPAVLLLLGVVTVLSVAHEYYDLLLLAWPFAAVLRWPVSRLWPGGTTSGHDTGVDLPGRSGDGVAPSAGAWQGNPTWAAVLVLGALPALVATVIPANDTLKLLGLGSGTAVISTFTTACLLVAMAGAMVVIAFDHPQEEGPDAGRYGPGRTWSRTRPGPAATPQLQADQVG